MLYIHVCFFSCFLHSSSSLSVFNASHLACAYAIYTIIKFVYFFLLYPHMFGFLCNQTRAMNRCRCFFCLHFFFLSSVCACHFQSAVLYDRNSCDRHAFTQNETHFGAGDNSKTHMGIVNQLANMLEIQTTNHKHSDPDHMRNIFVLSSSFMRQFRICIISNLTVVWAARAVFNAFSPYPVCECLNVDSILR